jgi:hypothetical protein
MKDFFLRMIVIPQLRSWAVYLAMKDENEIGPDDRSARLLITAAEELELYLKGKQ